MPVFPSADPRPVTKEEPLGSWPLILLFTTCTSCVLFLLYRRASQIRTVVSHQYVFLFNHDTGRIRLSVDDGPSAREFLDDDYDDDNERLADTDPGLAAAAAAQRARNAGPAALPAAPETDTEVLFTAEADEAPPPPPAK
ncbi:uncharacterized protein BXZ73DRAFT_91859 [Epithele typhae]|uniref:uncharacterized protein n=1 Tax=Epithele typhae TaxID=378194 RepID=UPI002008711E|nr:uncharacterized protein BXZ73DRAFT_91859 [Epithele typhae]KAH9920826.1 hypothetical protein BXZ73DRAFT_91859 [Epithele typhae]